MITDHIGFLLKLRNTSCNTFQCFRLKRHYSRSSNIHNKYLSPLLSVPKMHKLYLEKCKVETKPQHFHVLESSYRNIFVSEFKLPFGHPKSDTCSTCDVGEGNEEYVENYKAGYEMLKSNIEKAKELDNVTYLMVDFQQTMPLPRLSTSKAFYLTQLWLYNLGIHVVTKEGGKKTLFCV